MRLNSLGAGFLFQPDLPPVRELASRASAKRHACAAAHGPFKIDRIAKLSHLAGTVNDNSFNFPLYSAFLAANSTHIRSKKQTSVVRPFIERFANFLY